MAHKELAEIAAADPLNGTELFHAVQGSNSRRVAASDIKDFLLAHGDTAEKVTDLIMAALAETAGIDVIIDDENDTITIALDPAEVEASAAQMWTGGSSARIVTPKAIKDAAAPVAVAYAANVALDLNTGINFDIAALTGNIALDNPTNLKPGWSGSIRLVQDGTGGRTITFGNAWRFPGGAPTLSTAASAVDMLSYVVQTDGTVHGILSKAFSA